MPELMSFDVWQADRLRKLSQSGEYGARWIERTPEQLDFMYRAYLSHEAADRARHEATAAELKAYDTAAAAAPHLEIVKGVEAYRNLSPGDTIIHTPTAQELGGTSLGVGALGLLTTGMLTGGKVMANGNGQATLQAGDNPNTVVSTALSTVGGAVAKTGLGAALAALGITLPTGIAALLGVGVGAVGATLAGGVLGGNGSTTVDGIPVGGPGVAEPPAGMVAKQWHMLVHSNTTGWYWIYFFKLHDGRIMCYNPPVGWKIWRPKKMIVLSPDPRMSMIKKLDKVYNRTMRTLAKKTKALKLAH